MRGGIISQANRYLGGFCSSERIFPPQIIQVLLFVSFLRQQLRLGLGHEDAIELYYNAAIAPWINAALDLQIIDQALARTFDASGTRLRDLDTAVVLGLRVYARF